MTKTELELALAEATKTNKKTAGAFLDTLTGDRQSPGARSLRRLAQGPTDRLGRFVARSRVSLKAGKGSGFRW